MTYLIARKAEYNEKKASKIAYSSQFIDDNNRIYKIEDSIGEYVYKNYISQTKNILNTKRKLLRIYPVFHFIPGDPAAETAKRKDGKMHVLCCTPNSKNANIIMERALKTKDPYRIGIASHSYVDTWAHQNFIGIFDIYNSVKAGLWSFISPDIGHADVLTYPDLPGKKWTDPRLVNSKINNKERFLEAASFLFEHYATANEIKNISRKKEELISDLDFAIGGVDNDDSQRVTRKARYNQIAIKKEYGGKFIKRYDKHEWFDEAVTTKIRLFRDAKLPLGLKIIEDKFHPKNFDYVGFKQSDWYYFQQAIKYQQRDALECLFKTSLRDLKIQDF